MTGLSVTLRDYQEEAVASLYKWFERSTGNPLIVVPTGGGKSLIIAAFVHSVLSQWPNERILILTHVRELIAQNHAALLRCWPSAPAGIYSAGLRRREADARILFAGIQSVYEKANVIGWADLVIVDEAHLIPRSGFGMYRQLLEDLRSCNSHLKVIGLTATPFRTGEGSLDKGDDRMFHGIAYTCEVARLINQKWLSKVVARNGADAIETAGLHVRGGDFVEGELADAAMAGGLVRRHAAEIVQRGADRKAWLVFCVSVAHAEAVAEAIASHGVAVRTVFGETKKDERDAVVAGFKSGEIRCVVNVNVLTTGFDAPHIDLIALLRPTLSPVLYVQMVGRGLRLAPGKTHCLLLDYGGNVMRHGPIDAVNIREPKMGGEKGTVLARECPNCGILVSIASLVCPSCGFEWGVTEHADTGSKLDDKAAQLPDEAIVAGLAPRNPIERWDVQATRYRRQEGKNGKPATLCAEHQGGFQQRASEWVCFDHPHDSYPYKKACMWWKERGGHTPAPVSVEDARVRIEGGELWTVLSVTVDTRGEWPRLLAVRTEREPGLAETDVRAAADSDGDDLPF